MKPHFSKMKFKDWPEEAKKAYLKGYHDRGLERKKKLIEMKGGECKECGYKKSIRALSFHHKDPKEKSFKMTIREISGKNWDTLLKEAEKCDLLCANCHMELHENERGGT